MRMPARAQVDGLLCVGIAGALGVLALMLHTRSWSAGPAALLPLAFLVAGGLGGRARPEHRGVRLLLAVGAAHLGAFALLGWLGVGHPHGWGPWLLGLLGAAVYLLGFLALAAVAVTFPTGRVRTTGQRRFLTFAAGFVVLAVVDEALFRPRIDAAASGSVHPIPAPAPFPLVDLGFDLGGLVALLVIVAFAIMARGARDLDDDERRALSWATLTFAVLALLLALSPAANALVSDAVWTAVFVTVVSAIPFLLLAGLVRYRQLRVELYVGRTIGRGVVVLVVVSLVALAVTTTSRAGATAATAVIAGLAAVFGAPLARRLERVADRWLTGGRVGRDALLDHVDADLARTDPAELPHRLTALVAAGLDVAWVRLGPADGPPAEASVALVAAGGMVGVLECGPRRGGWRPADLAMLRRLAGPVALALRNARLTAELADQVAELTASRERLVQAEDTARRRVERDLHDGVQQQLVALLARLTVAQAQAAPGTPTAAALTAAHDLAQQALRDLRELVAGIHPPLLGDRGLVAAVEARAGLLPLTVAVDADPRLESTRFPPEVEGAGYFVVLEALANVMKHSGSDRCRVVLALLAPAGLRVAVVDEGNGAAAWTGSGLTGLRDRVEALGGTFTLQASPGVGTTVVAEFGTAVPVAVRADA